MRQCTYSVYEAAESVPTQGLDARPGVAGRDGAVSGWRPDRAASRMRRYGAELVHRLTHIRRDYRRKQTRLAGHDGRSRL